MTTKRGRILRSVRVATGRMLGPLSGRRHGYFFVARRSVASFLDLMARATRPPAALRVVSAREVAAAAGGARLLDGGPGVPVLVIPGGVVVAPGGHVGPDPYRIVTEFDSGTTRRAEVRSLRRVAAADPDRAVTLPGASANLMLGSPGNYCVWMTQGLSRLDAIMTRPGLPPCDRFLVGPETPPHVFETLAAFGVDRERVHVVGVEPQVYRCEVLVAPGIARSMGSARRDQLEGLRARFCVRAVPPAPCAPRRVYLARGPAARRRVVNEDGVVSELARRGFRVVTMDGRSVAEQAALLSRAECIVAPHGAALTNLIWAPPGVTIVELVNRNLPDPTFRQLSATLGRRYFAVDGLEPRVPPFLPRARFYDADTVVDVDGLSTLLDTNGFGIVTPSG